MTQLLSADRWLRVMPAVFVLIWSSGFIVAKFGLPHASPLLFLAVRYALSVVCFVVWIRLARAAWPQGRIQWLHLAVTGMLMHGGYLGGVWIAVKAGMGSGLVALVVGFQPVLTAVWVSYTFRKHTGGQGVSVTSRQWLGLMLGLAGLLLVVWRKLDVGGEVSILTMGSALFALLCITVGTLYQKSFIKPCDVRTANAIQLAAALLITLPFAAIEGGGFIVNSQLVLAMGWSVLVLTLGGSSLLYLLIQRGAATAVTSLLYLVPPTTAFMAWLLFREEITLVTIVGTALTAVGVSLVVARVTAAPTPAP